MNGEVHTDANDAAGISDESLRLLLESHDEATLREALNHPAISEPQICVLLARKDLSETLIEEIAKRKKWRASYRVRRALTEHPHTPRLIAMRGLRDLYLMDLVRISIAPGCRVELRRMAEERVLAQLPQLPLGQRFALSLRGSARVAAAIVVHGPPDASRRALDNPYLTESQLLKALSRDDISSFILALVAQHAKWPNSPNVRMALLRHPNIPPNLAPAIAQNLLRSELEDLLALTRLSTRIRELLQSELANRTE